MERARRVSDALRFIPLNKGDYASTHRARGRRRRRRRRRGFICI